MGHSEQGDGRREEERLRPREEDQHELVPEGRPDRGSRFGVAFEVGTVGVGAQGGGHAQASGSRVVAQAVVGLFLTEARVEPDGAEELGQTAARDEALAEPVAEAGVALSPGRSQGSG